MFKKEVSDSLERQMEEFKFVKINQQESFEKINRIIDELKEIRQEDRRAEEMVKDFELRRSALKERPRDQILLEERINRLAELTMETKKRLDSAINFIENNSEAIQRQSLSPRKHEIDREVQYSDF